MSRPVQGHDRCSAHDENPQSPSSKGNTAIPARTRRPPRSTGTVILEPEGGGEPLAARTTLFVTGRLTVPTRALQLPFALASPSLQLEFDVAEELPLIEKHAQHLAHDNERRPGHDPRHHEPDHRQHLFDDGLPRELSPRHIQHQRARREDEAEQHEQHAHTDEHSSPEPCEPGIHHPLRRSAKRHRPSERQRGGEVSVTSPRLESILTVNRSRKSRPSSPSPLAWGISYTATRMFVTLAAPTLSESTMT